MVIRVYFTNFGYFSQEEFSNFDDAIAYVISKGFEASLWERTDSGNFEPLAAWSPIRGVVIY